VTAQSAPPDRAFGPGSLSLQDQHAAKSICFGCGPANEHGLHIKSFVHGDEVVADFTPAPYHHAFPGMLNGGIIGTLLDCHSNWAACHHLMVRNDLDAPPCTVTADFHVRLRKPTPLAPVRLVARITSSTEDRAIVEAELSSNGVVTARCTGTFVAVKEGHPAYHRW
jgi:acyl-coenzyme A thioesterase PaaI-like protein